MDEPKPGQVDHILAEALEREPNEREAFVVDRCHGDENLVREVMSLLEAYERAGTFLESGVKPLQDPLLGRQVDRYRILSRLGEGGMADVYLAERADDTFHKQVALKRIRRGLDGDHILARFQAERQALANLEHSNIARLLDGGSTEDGHPFLVMEYVDGLRLDVHCDDSRASIDERLRLFLDVCSAVQFAHQRLIVHRDLKPANILVAADGTVKLLDFGVAKFLDPEQSLAHTVTQHQIYTPAYASPEQVRRETITTATDVYALGVVLFELLTGRLPYRLGESPSWAEVNQAVCDEPPTRPSRAIETRLPSDETSEQLARRRSTREADLRRELEGDLEVILLKALHKQPERRYESVEALAEDIRRFRTGLPVLAQGDSWGYRARKFVGRNRALVVALTAAVLALVAGLATSTTLFLQAQRAREGEREQRIQAENTSEFLESLLGTINPDTARGRDTQLIQEILREAAGRVDEELVDVPATAARVHRVIGSAYDSIGDYEEARVHLDRSAELYRGQSGASSEELAVALAARGNLEANLGNYSGAAEELLEAIELLEQASASRSPDAAEAHLQLARVRANEGKTADSIAILEDLLTWVGSLPDVSPAQGQAMRLLGRGYAIDMRLDEAVALLEQARDFHVESYGSEHRLTAAAFGSLGWAQYRAGDSQAAEPNFKEALRIYQEVMPADHPDIASALNQLAGAVQNQGRLEEAEALFQEALTRFRATYGDEHPDVATAYNNLGRVYADQERHDQAIEALQGAVNTYKAVLGPEHIFVGIVQQNILAIYDDQDRLREVGEMIEEARRIRTQGFDEEDLRNRYIHALAAMSKAYEGDFATAEPILLASEQALADAEDSLVPRVRRLLVRFYELRGQTDAADRWRARLD